MSRRTGRARRCPVPSGAAAPAWTPASLDRMLELRGDDAADGSLVSWPARAGGFSLTPPGTAPVGIPNVLGTHRVVRAAGVSPLQTLASGLVFHGRTTCTLAMVFRVANADTQMPFHVGGDTLRVATTGGSLIVVPDDSQVGYATVAGVIVTNAWNRLIVRYNGAAGTDALRLRLRLNGVDLAPSYAGTVPSSLALTDGPIVIGRYGSDGGFYFVGDMAWVAVSRPCEDDSTRALIDTWMSAEFSLLPKGNGNPKQRAGHVSATGVSRRMERSRRMPAAGVRFTPDSLYPVHRFVGSDAGLGSIPTWAARNGLAVNAGTNPVGVANAYNGCGAVRFAQDSSQYLSETASTYLATGTACTIVAVYRAVWASSALWCSRGDKLWVQSYQGFAQLATTGSGQYNRSAPLGDLGLTRVIWRLDGTAVGDGNRLRLRANGVDQPLTHVGAVPSALSLPAGSMVGKGNLVGGGTFADGDLVELYVIPTCVSDAVAAQIDADLVRRYCPHVLYCAGDSNVAGHGTTGGDSGRLTAFPSLISQMAGVRSGGTDVRSYGIDGEDFVELLADAPTLIGPYAAAAYSRRTLVISCGANDIGFGVTDGAGALARLILFIAWARTAGFTDIFVCTIAPCQFAGLGVSVATFDAYRAAYRTGLIALETAEVITMIDVAADPRLSDCTNLTYYQSDKTHWTDAGQVAAAEVVHAGVAARLLPRGTNDNAPDQWRRRPPQHRPRPHATAPRRGGLTRDAASLALRAPGHDRSARRGAAHDDRTPRDGRREPGADAPPSGRRVAPTGPGAGRAQSRPGRHHPRGGTARCGWWRAGQGGQRARRSARPHRGAARPHRQAGRRSRPRDSSPREAADLEAGGAVRLRRERDHYPDSGRHHPRQDPRRRLGAPMTETRIIWAAVAAVVIHLLVRALKSDRTPWPLDRIPAGSRPFVALGLGVVSGILESIALGTPWKQAVVAGLGSASGAIVGHDTMIEGARGGRELGVPKTPPPSLAVGLPRVEVTFDDERPVDTQRTRDLPSDGGERR